MNTEDMQAYVRGGEKYDMLKYFTSLKDKYAVKKLMEANFISKLLDASNKVMFGVHIRNGEIEDVIEDLSDELAMSFDNTRKAVFELSKRMLDIYMLELAVMGSSFIVMAGSKEERAQKKQITKEIKETLADKLKEPVLA